MFPKIMGFPPKSSIFNRVFHYKPSILRYPYFWKHPHLCFFLKMSWIWLLHVLLDPRGCRCGCWKDAGWLCQLFFSMDRQGKGTLMRERPGTTHTWWRCWKRRQQMDWIWFGDIWRLPRGLELEMNMEPIARSFSNFCLWFLGMRGLWIMAVFGMSILLCQLRRRSSAGQIMREESWGFQFFPCGRHVSNAFSGPAARDDWMFFW